MRQGDWSEISGGVRGESWGGSDQRQRMDICEIVSKQANDIHKRKMQKHKFKMKYLQTQ